MKKKKLLRKLGDIQKELVKIQLKFNALFMQIVDLREELQEEPDNNHD